jgi:hypothetical protein
VVIAQLDRSAHLLCSFPMAFASDTLSSISRFSMDLGLLDRQSHLFSRRSLFSVNGVGSTCGMFCFHGRWITIGSGNGIGLMMCMTTMNSCAYIWCENSNCTSMTSCHRIFSAGFTFVYWLYLSCSTFCQLSIHSFNQGLCDVEVCAYGTYIFTCGLVRKLDPRYVRLDPSSFMKGLLSSSLPCLLNRFCLS